MSSSDAPATRALIAELEQEALATRRLLEAVPADKLDWTPHGRSFSLRGLAGHTAEIPGRVSTMLAEPSFDFSSRTGVAHPGSKEELLAAFDASLATARQTLAGWTADDLAATWSAHNAGQPVMAMPRGIATRMIMFNHLYHHRGQLSVYLRLLDVPLPSVYGPTADVNPFA